jgi:hypothetical protein
VTKFRKALCKRLDTQARLSSPYHPQTNGQTEQFNAVMEQYLCCFVNYLQNDWKLWLSLSECAANDQASESTGVSSFLAKYGYDPKWQSNVRQDEKSLLIAAETVAHETAGQLKEIQEHLETKILQAQYRYSKGADRRRTSALVFKEGDRVWLNTKNIVTRCPSRKLKHRRIRPFKIIKVVSPGPISWNCQIKLGLILFSTSPT